MPNKRAGNVFVVSAPSGGGKTTLAGQILRAMNDVERSVSMTTRPAREGEVEGRDYSFVSESEFKTFIEKDRFLEFAKVFRHYYGTPRDFVMRQIERGKDVLLLIDVQGARKVKRAMKNCVRIFVMPPSFEELKRRLEKRSTDSSEEIKHRLELAKNEMEEAQKFDYVIVNEDLAKAVDELRSIIISERNRVKK